MEEVVSIVGALFSLLSLTFFYNNGNISKLEVFKSKAAHEFFSESSNYSTDFSIFSPSWNIDLRARPWALWNFLRSTSPLTHRCRNIIPPARYFNLALSTRQEPEKKLHRFSLSSLFFFSHSLHFPRKAGCVRFLKNVASNVGWKMETILFLIGCRARVCVKRNHVTNAWEESYRREKFIDYFRITFSWKTHR